MKQYYLGVDLGTTAVKVVLFDETGMAVCEASQELSLLYPNPGQIEQSPYDWYETPCQLIREVCRDCMPGSVKAIGISSQGISIVPVDESFEPLSNGISWLDIRADRELEEMLQVMPEKQWFAITGKHPSTSYSLPKLLWLKKNQSALFEKAHMFLMPLDYLTARLCGNTVTDATMAGGTMLYNLQEKAWSKKICQAFGIPQEKLPDILPTTALAGWMNEESKKIAGLTGDIMVAVGAQDQKIAALGAGIATGVVTMSLGTAGAMEFLCENESEVLPSFSFDTFDQVSYVLEGCINTFGAAIKWARDHVFKGLSYREMDALAEQAPIGSGGVRFYPHLSGVSTPHYGEELRAGWVGMTLETDRGCLIRSLYEGLACEVRMNVEAAKRAGANVEKLRIFGGSSKSDILCQILSDVTGLPVEAMAFTEIAAFGAAKVANICHNREKKIDSASQFCFPNQVRNYCPNAYEAEVLYRRYIRKDDITFGRREQDRLC